MDTVRQVCTFHVDDLLLGVDVELVQEVMKPPSVTRVPLAKDTARGLINLRGQIVTAIDLRACMSRRPFSTADQALAVIVRSESTPICLLVDVIGEVVEIDESQLVPPPESLDSSTALLTKGACRLPDRLLLVLNSQAVIDQVTNAHCSAVE